MIERLSIAASHRIAVAVAILLAVPGASAAAQPTAAERPLEATARGDAALRRALDLRLPEIEKAGRLADRGRGESARIQAQYDAARDLDEALAAVGPVSQGCRQLLTRARALARAHVMQAEGADRFRPSIVAAGVRRAVAARSALSRLPRDCSSGRVVRAEPALPELDQPRSSEAFAGRAEALAPPGTDRVDVLVGGTTAGSATLEGRRASIELRGGHEGEGIELRYRRSGKLIGRARSGDTWLLPRNSERFRAARADRTLSERLGRLGSAFDGQSGIWIHDLSSGRAGGWNEDALFPAASTVKLGVLIAALERFGRRPERSGVAHDMRALSAWSSNLAANRLVRILGRGSTYSGSLLAQSTLRRLGAGSSSYPGEYLVGTSLTSGLRLDAAPDPPPRVSSRVTSARDLGRILYWLHSAAMGSKAAVKKTGLTRHEARVGLAFLLASEPRGENTGLIRPAADKSMPIAQKHGWLDDARHTAAILYTDRGPVVVVVMTYREGMDRARAVALGARVTREALSLRRR